MTRIRRPAKQQRVTLLRIFLFLAGVLGGAIFLFRLDAFPENHGRRRKRSAPLTPETLLTQEFIRKRQTSKDDVRPVTSKKNEAESRRFAFELANLSDGATTGVVIIETRPSWAPLGVEHLHKLLDAQFYDQCRFFRTVRNFMVQFGIAADPKVQAKWRQDVIRDDPVIQTNSRGTVTFATSGKNTRTTQLFINTKTRGNAYLDKEGFAPVAHVIEGMEHVDQIYHGYGEKPVQNKIVKRGNEYLEKEFPKLSYIVSVKEIPMGDKKEEVMAAQ